MTRCAIRKCSSKWSASPARIAWEPYYFRNDYVGVEQYSRLNRGGVAQVRPRLLHEHQHLARMWGPEPPITGLRGSVPADASRRGDPPIAAFRGCNRPFVAAHARPRIARTREMITGAASPRARSAFAAASTRAVSPRSTSARSASWPVRCEITGSLASRQFCRRK